MGNPNPYGGILDGLEGDGSSNDTESDAERRKRIKDKLREGGADIPLTDSEMLDLIDEYYRKIEEQASGPAEEQFRQGLQNGVGIAGFQNAQDVANQSRRNNPNTGILDQIIGAYIQANSPKESAPKPSVIQLPNNDDVFNAVMAVAAGPSPSSLFRDVFAEAYPTNLAQPSPFQAFVQNQEKELQARFVQQTFNEFTQPGYTDQLKSDYAVLERQADNQRIAGSGGTVPSYEDFIRDRVKSNYMQFLAGEKPKLEQAFQLTSPQERGQNAPGQRIAPRRIL